MPSGYDDGDDIGIAPMTARGRNWPCLRQFCVFMENRVGRLNELLRHIERTDLRVVALSVVDTEDFAVARIMVDNTDRAREIFALNNFTVIENDILGVILPDDPQPFVSIFMAMVSAELNISYTYPLIYRRARNGAIAVHVDDIDQATHILSGLGHTLLTEQDLLEDDLY